jgi:hypothetical protein
MTARTRTLVSALGFLTLATAGCELIDLIPPGGGSHPGTPPVPPHACTAIGCSDQLMVRVQPQGGLLPRGSHTVTVTPENEPARTCQFVVTEGAAPVPGVGGTAPVASCSPGLWVWIFQKQTCTTSTNGQTASQTCVPVPGQWEEQITVNGTPVRAHLTQQVDGRLILEKDLRPTYKESRPNGPTCGPVCKQASVDLPL